MQIWIEGNGMSDKKVFHITSGDIAGEMIAEAGFEGDILVWHDLLYEGTRNVGWPNSDTIESRSEMLESFTGGGLSKSDIQSTMNEQYRALKQADDYDQMLLWFDACLFDQSMLCHILALLSEIVGDIKKLQLLVIDEYPGIERYDGIGNLTIEQLKSCVSRKSAVTKEQIEIAKMVDRAFATQDKKLFRELAVKSDCVLPWIPAAVKRWKQEFANSVTGLGRMEQMILDAVNNGCSDPLSIYDAVKGMETPPQYWGDTTLWNKINDLADRNPAVLAIKGPNGSNRLPVWNPNNSIRSYRITKAQN